MFVALGWLLSVALRILRQMFFLAIAAITSIFLGVETTIDRIADSWVADGQAIGIPNSQTIREGAKAVAGFALVCGWIVLVGLVVFAFNLLL